MSEKSGSLHATENPIAFFCRAKPQNADALRICMEAKRIFIGYPLLRRGDRYDPSALGRCLVNPTCSDEEWRREIARRGSTRSFNRNRNFIPLVTRGSIVVIPRPEHGAVYVGRICGPFEIVDSPPWADAYLALRAEQRVCTDDEEKPPYRRRSTGLASRRVQKTRSVAPTRLAAEFDVRASYVWSIQGSSNRLERGVRLPSAFPDLGRAIHYSDIVDT